MAWSLKDKLKELGAQVNTFDGGATAQTVRQQRQQQVAAQTVRNQSTPGTMEYKVKNARYGVLANNAGQQQQLLNNARPAQFDVAQATRDTLRNRATGLGLGVARSGVGIAQGVSGLTDLVTPGTGTNRVSKSLDRSAKFIDQTAKNEGVGNMYKVGQAAGDLLSFAAPSAAVSGISKLPQVARFARPATNVVNRMNAVPQRAASTLARRGPGGRIAAAGVGNATVGNMANIAAGTGLDLGSRSGKGQDISGKDVALSAGMNAAVGLGLPVLAQAGIEGVKAAPKAARGAARMAQEADRKAFTPRGQQTQTKTVPINQLVREDLQGYGEVDPERVAYYVQAMKKGATVKDPVVMTGPDGRLYVEDGKNRLAAMAQLGRKQARVKVVPDYKAAAQGGYVQLPGQKSDVPAPAVADDAMEQVFDQNPMKPDNQPKLKGNDAGETPAPLPEINTNKVGGLQKAFRSTRSIIERQGEAGKQLGGLLQKARDDKEIYLARLQKAMPNLTQLARGKALAINNKEFENFVDATQGLAQPMNDKVRKAIGEWQAIHPTIRQRAVDAGLDVGDLGPNYYPHFIDYDTIFKDKNKFNQAINHLVETNQAPTQEEAIKLLGYARDVSRNREFGNLEASRLVDLPFYDKTPNSLISYLNGSANRITHTETLGKGDENALKLIAQAGQEGFDTEAMKNAYDIAAGAKNYNPTTDKVSRNIRQYITTTRLGLGALTNVSQNVNTGIVTGHLRTMNSMVKQLDPKTREFVQDTGVISDAILNTMRSQQGDTFSQKFFGKALQKITAPGFGAVEKFNRSVSATAGRDYALRLAQKGDEKTLRGLGVTGPIKDKTLSIDQQVQAARKIVEKTQFKVDAQDLPGWVDSPGGKLVAQFRTFSYNQQKFFLNEIINPIKSGNLMPAARLLAALPLGYGLYEARRRIDGRPTEENQDKVVLATFQKVGGAGISTDLLSSVNPLGSKYLPSDRRGQMVAGALGGPAVGVGLQGVGAISDLVQRKNTPQDESRLEGKVAVGNTGETYTDATPAARFAVSQVPIVGTPIKNRLLPYKKESEADSGVAKVGAEALPMDEKAKKEIYNAAFNNTEGKAFMKLKNDQERKDQYPELYKQYEAMKKRFSNSEGSKPKNVDKLPTGLKEEVTNFFDKSAKLTTEGRETWIKSKAEGEAAKLTARAKKLVPEGYPELPNTNRVAEMYAKYKAAEESGKLTGTRLNKEKIKFLREAYKSELDDNDKFWIDDATDDDIFTAIDNGELSPEQMDKLINLDNLTVKLRGKKSFGSKLRNKLGYEDTQAPGSSSGKKKLGKLDYNLYGMSDRLSKEQSLRSMLKKATL
jgi:hypothetical protein